MMEIFNFQGTRQGLRGFYYQAFGETGGRIRYPMATPERGAEGVQVPDPLCVRGSEGRADLPKATFASSLIMISRCLNLGRECLGCHLFHLCFWGKDLNLTRRCSDPR